MDMEIYLGHGNLSSFLKSRKSVEYFLFETEWRIEMECEIELIEVDCAFLEQEIISVRLIENAE